jgi:hypothetical protein
VSAIGEARQTIVRHARQLEELVKARLEVDVTGLVAGVRARLESRLALKPIPVAADLADKPGPFGLGHVRTLAWECPEARKVVLSHVAMRPLIEGLALVIHPSKRAAPIFGADLMALPTRLSVNSDVYGSRARTEGVFTDLAESFGRLGSHPGPSWAQAIASGQGLHARCSLRLVDGVFAALTGALGHYLDKLATAPVLTDDDGAAGRDFFAAFHAHGPRRGPLGHVLGAAWAERYSRLIFE